MLNLSGRVIEYHIVNLAQLFIVGALDLGASEVVRGLIDIIIEAIIAKHSVMRHCLLL
jgi:hypothetical protein